jgi:radical SAM enzyme (TIGR01210 family)
MGLETVHPQVLKKLNKRMTLDQFSRAAEFLRSNGVALRVFVLIKPPFLNEEEGLYWAERSTEFAFSLGATAVSLIPTRPGNGALELLQQQGQFSSPKLASLEAALAHGIRLGRGRVFADLWDLEQFSECPHCFPGRLARLRRMNLEQTLMPVIACAQCGAGAIR